MMVIHNIFIIFKPFSFVSCMEASEFCCRFISLIQVIFFIYLYVKINEEEEWATMTNNHMMDIYIIHMRWIPLFGLDPDVTNLVREADLVTSK